MGTPAVTFNFQTWTAMFPEFAPLTSAQGNGYFLRASMYFANDQGNPAFPDGNLQQLLYLLTSHIAWLNCPKDANGNPSATGTIASQLVGRISSATEGSVSVQTEWNGSPSALEAWMIQTKYGAEFWAMTAQYRTARYLPNPTIMLNKGRRGLGLLPPNWPIV
jgi:hypothetical protein